MKIYRDLTPIGESSAVALGYFDGVHKGHQAVLHSASSCKKQGLVPTAFTFATTPKAKDVKNQLSTYNEKIKLIEATGIEILYIIDFQSIRNLSPDEFVNQVLKKVFNAKKVFCGFNYHFGKMGSGNTEDLVRICMAQSIDATVIDPVIINEQVVSSSAIRQYIQSGEIEKANALLGYDFGYISHSVQGNKIGSAMGTPTINQDIEDNLVLAKFGVYASIVKIDNQLHYGVTNIGVKPTINYGNKPNCETWLPLYNGGDLYNKTIDTRLKAFMRPEQKFESLNALETAIKNDGKKAVEILNKLMH